MKSFTERNPLFIGLIAIAVIIVGTTAALVLNASLFARLSGNYTISAVFADTAGLRGGDRVTVAGVQVGSVGAIRQQGNAVRVNLKINHGVQLTSDTSAAIHVETLLGRKAVKLVTGSDWGHLLRGGAVITKTSSPTEVLDVQTDAQGALQQLDAQSLNNFLADLALFTKGKRNEVTTILDGLNRLTGTINERRGQLATLIDSAATVSKTLASRDQTLVQAIDDLEVVVQGLAERRAELTQLLDNTSAAAGQIAGLVGANRTKLDAILAELHTDLAIIGQHQVDLAQSVAYLASGIEGFQSIGYSGPNNYPQPWANVFTVGLGPASADPVFGCGGAVDQALTVAVGPDPLPCSQAVGPVGTSVGVTGAGRALPVGTAATTAASIESLLTPLLVGP